MLLSPLALAADLDTTDLETGWLTGRGGLRIDRPETGHAGEIAVGAAIPFQLLPEGGSPWWTGDIGLRLGASWTPVRRLRLDLRAPLHPLLWGGEWLGSALGDVELGGTALLVDGKQFSAALRPSLGLPTGTTRWGLGTGAFTGGLHALGEFRPGDDWFMDLELGVDSAPAAPYGEASLGSSVRGALGVGIAPSEYTTLGGELSADIAAADGVDPLDLDVEVHAYGMFRSRSGVVVSLAAGRRLAEAPGAPDLRLIAGLGWVRPGTPPVVDQDGDHVLDEDDACPTVREDADAFRDDDGCPDPDNDDDGRPDAVDRCPGEAEDLDGAADEDGCPDKDNDGDTVLDGDDDCPDIPGAIRTMGCPDRDGDAIADREDLCPDLRGDRDHQGCSTVSVRVDTPPSPTVEVPAPSAIRFETATATLLPESEVELAKVVRWLAAHPEIKLLEVAGHTDGQGADGANLELSRARAQAVVGWLIAHGVERARLVANGYGESRPVDTNATESGRAANRRVEFVILRGR